MSSSRSSPRNPAALSSLYRGSERPPSWVHGSVPAVKSFPRRVRRLAGIPSRCTPGVHAGGGRQTSLSSFPGRLCREHGKKDAVYKERLCRPIRRSGGNTLLRSGVGRGTGSVLVLYSRMLPGARALMGKGTGSGFFPWSGPWRLSPRRWGLALQIRLHPSDVPPPYPASLEGILTPILW
jgi:hypothetical protein